MVINDDRRKVIFIHIPKCGGISIENTIHKELGGDSFISRNQLINLPPKQDNKEYTKLYLHSTLSDYKKYIGNEEIKDFYIFSFVRNPWRRMVSHYEYLIKQMYNKSINENDILTFPSFVQVYKTNILMYSFKSYDYYLKDDKIEKINFIGKLENINEDLKKVGDDIKMEIKEVLHMNQTDPILKEHENWRDYYNPGLKDIVYKTFKYDIEKYNYEFDE
jgi:hypothetical protein